MLCVCVVLETLRGGFVFIFMCFYFVTASTPPTSSPGPPTTENIKDMSEVRYDVNNTFSNGQFHPNSIHVASEKSMC